MFPELVPGSRAALTVEQRPDFGEYLGALGLDDRFGL
jgi:hypothetical protein